MTPRQSEQLRALEKALGRWLHEEKAFKRRPPKNWSVWSINSTRSTSTKPLNNALTPRQWLAVRLFMMTRQALVWPEEDRALAVELETWIAQTGRLRDRLANYSAAVKRELEGVLKLRHSRKTPPKMRRQLSKMSTVVRLLDRLPAEVEASLDPRPFRMPLRRQLALSKAQSNVPLHMYTELLQRAGYSAAQRARITGITKKSDDADTQKRVKANMRRAVSRRKRPRAKGRKPREKPR